MMTCAFVWRFHGALMVAHYDELSIGTFIVLSLGCTRVFITHSWTSLVLPLRLLPFFSGTSMVLSYGGVRAIMPHGDFDKRFGRRITFGASIFNG